MAKGFAKKPSKRLTCHKRYKILKKVREHHRKARREAKKSGKRKASKKDPGIPKSLPEPMKEACEKYVLGEKERREAAKVLKRKRKEDAKNVPATEDSNVSDKSKLSDLVKSAEQRTKEFNSSLLPHPLRVGVRSRNVKRIAQNTNAVRQYCRQFEKVVAAADIVLQVLDARDPLGSRCPQVERMAIDAGKRLVLVLNKIDLVPRQNVLDWLKYLRREFPTLPFKASTQSQREHLSQKMYVFGADEEIAASARCLGAPQLMRLLAGYRRSDGGAMTSVVVGVVGFPNTGKSSLINSLKRARVCNVGAVPGVTRQSQEVAIDKGVRVLDSPGVVLARGTNEATLVLRNCINLCSVSDPLPAVDAIVKRCGRDQLMARYALPHFDNVDQFVAHFARRFGKFRKGGVPDVNKASRLLLQDWNSGKLRYYTVPPTDTADEPSSSPLKLVSGGFAPEFDIEALTKETDKMVTDEIPSADDDAVPFESTGPTPGVVDEADVADDGDDEMESEDDDDLASEDDEDDDDDEPPDAKAPKLSAGLTVEALAPARPEKRRKAVRFAKTGGRAVEVAPSRDVDADGDAKMAPPPAPAARKTLLDIIKADASKAAAAKSQKPALRPNVDRAKERTDKGALADIAHAERSEANSLNRQLSRHLKRAKKLKRRNVTSAAKLSDQLADSMQCFGDKSAGFDADMN